MRVSGWLYILEQFICALSLLCAAGRIIRVPRTSPWRLMLTALLNALCTTIAAVSASAPLLLFVLLLSLLSPAALWPGLPRKLRRSLAPALLLLLLLCSGCIRFLRQLPLPPWLSVLVACLLLPLSARAPSPSLPSCITTEIRCGTSRVTLTALIDTGNLLRDPLTALPVVVIARRAAHRLIPPPVPGQLNPGLRQIPIRTVAGVTAMTVFRPASLRLMHGGRWIEGQAIIGIAPDGYDGIQALVPASLLTSSPLTQGG